ncbi:LOW QUALITY PROTEIN: bone morphogenetic protein 15 [Cyprinodon tularosa]|uniref:LOW QUALITY PROTEIN: bone morphogenetic protein 15 n=1 Tax=Cyprinodon tularosa TaxID=77115 RepID=UPI0018E2342E|nr:LOW QUALITY PROTEIN: bone morphogenetic protein 15 [Cyprinodon tularosa]
MRVTHAKHGFLRVCLLTCFLYLLCSTCVAGPALRRSRRSHRGAHHRPLTDEQKADQNLQFMLSLYRSAAEPDGRPKQHRKFGSNTVRLLRPAASSVRSLPASGDLTYTFTVQYKLDTLPSEQLIRASFIHLRSSSTPSGTTQAIEPPRCRAQITSLGASSLVTLEPHQRWTETDITAHVSAHILQERDQGERGHLTLTAQYWCAAPAGEDWGPSWWWTPIWGRRRWSGEPQLEVPSLLLYLEEEREVKEWMGDLLGAEGENLMKRIGWWGQPSIRHPRSSKEVSPPDAKNSSLDELKNELASSLASSPASIFDNPNYRRKTDVPKNRCKLHSFNLAFNELGLGHYFIAPRVYNPRFCQGDCPKVLHYGYHSPNHAIIQTLIKELGVGDVPAPSCVPYKYMPMSVLVVYKKKVDYRELEDMVAESCTCR